MNYSRLCLLLALFLPMLSFAQLVPQGELYRSVEMERVSAIDLNGDGLEDLVLDRLGWIPMEANGQLGTLQLFPDEVMGFDKMLDFDNDGDMDWGFVGNGLDWYLNDNGKFVEGFDIQLGADAPYNVYRWPYDVDQDGLVDFIYVDESTNAWYLSDVYWEKHLPDHSFAPGTPSNLDLDSEPYIFSLKKESTNDLLLYANYEDGIKVLKYDPATSQFAPFQDQPLFDLGPYDDVVWFDYDLDGDDDIITTTSINVNIIENKGNALFEKAGVIDNSSSFPTPFHLARFSHLEDVTGNGQADFILRSGKYFSAVNGGLPDDLEEFQDPIMTDVDVEIKYAIDLDEDGTLDLIFQSEAGLTLQRSINLQVRSENDWFFENQIQRVTMARDLDHNGTMELIGMAGNKIFIIDYTANGSDYSKAEFIYTYSGEANISFQDLLAKDIDNDGDEDLLWQDWKFGQVYISINDGENNFADPVTWQLSNDQRVTPHLFGDINQDGILDFLYFSSSSTFSRLVIQKSVGGNLEYESTYTNVDFLMSYIQLIDIDNDGWLDFVFKKNGNEGYAWVKNNEGNFDLEAINLALVELEANFNGTAIFVKNEVQNSIEAFRYSYLSKAIDHFVFNPGTATFDSISRISEGIYTPVLAEDLDADGDLDLYLYDEQLNKYFSATIENETITNAEPLAQFPAAHPKYGVFSDDLNTDGVADYYNLHGTVAFGDNSGGQNLDIIYEPRYAFQESYNFIDYVDLDNDGDLDQVSKTRSTCAWRENLGDYNFSLARNIALVPFIGAANDKYDPVYYDLDGNGLMDIFSPFYEGCYKFMNYGDSWDTIAIQDERKNLVSYSIHAIVPGTFDALIGFDEATDEFHVYKFDPIAQDFIFHSTLNVNTNQVGIKWVDNFFSFDFDHDGADELLYNVIDDNVDAVSFLVKYDQDNDQFLESEFLGPSQDVFYSFAVADLNGDGAADLIGEHYDGANKNNDGLGYWAGPDFSSFPANKQFISSLNISDPQPVDFDLDGDLDIFAGSAWLENVDGLGKFLAQQRIPDFGGSYSTVSNLDGDEYIEFFSTDVYHFNAQLNNQLDPINEQLASLMTEPSKAISIDPNADGKGDIILLFDEVGDFALAGSAGMYFKQTGTEEVWEFEIPSQDDIITVWSPNVFTNYDFNNDGLADILEARGTVYLRLNNGDGTYAEARKVCQCVTSSWLEHDLQFADLDQDGDLDFTIKIKSQKEITFVENKSEIEPGLLIPHNKGQLAANGDIILEDIDGNGKFDLVLKHTIGNEKGLRYYKDVNFSSSGLGSLHNLAIVQIYGGFRDLDGDGDWDMVGGATVPGVLAAQINDGNWNFTTVESLAKEDITASYLADINGDYLLDYVLLTDTWNNEEFGFQLQQPDGTYGEFIPVPGVNAKFVERMLPIDIDGDLDQDVILSMSSGQCLLFENISESLKLTIQSFFDENQNELRDVDEVSLGNVQFRLSPYPVFEFPNALDETVYSLGEGNYEVESFPPDGWKTTSSNLPIEVSITEDQLLEVGFYPEVENRELFVHAVAARQRCNSIAPVWLTVTNTGTMPEDVSLKLEFNPLTTFLSSVPIDPGNVSNDSVIWNLGTLYPQQKVVINCAFQVPDEMQTGELLNYFMTASFADPTLEKYSFLVDDAVVRCSFDPNDKLVSPNRLAEGFAENETLFEETLRYTIRFQNTGNDTAYHVRITDQLDANLDFETFNVLSSSHPVRSSMTSTGFVTFNFDDIYLVDSMTNDLGSQGYVSFSIEELENLPEGTEINNCAEIYFDFNPPIKTNETSSILVTQLSTSTSELTAEKMRLFPNPILRGEEMVIEQPWQHAEAYIYHISGQLISKTEIPSNWTFSTANLTGGYYYLQIQNEGKVLQQPFVVLE